MLQQALSAYAAQICLYTKVETFSHSTGGAVPNDRGDTRISSIFGWLVEQPGHCLSWLPSLKDALWNVVTS